MMKAMKDIFSTAGFCTLFAAAAGGVAAAATIYAFVIAPAMAGVADYALAASEVVR
ncbi:MAG TPA: hypothetical protein VNH64_08430 [Parvularculaceae bacterium]|nr:hypothetical protein [Parvularculaceae bacterium]